MPRTKLFEEYEKYEKEVLKYVDECKLIKKPITKAGLAAHLGVSRATVVNYSKLSNEHKKLYAYFTSLCERDLINNALVGNYDKTFSMFLLKCNYGYVDKQVVETHHSNDLLKAMVEEIKGGE